MIYAPIALFVFNRADHTEETINALLKNEESAVSDLIIYSDAAKNIQQEPAVKAVRDYISKIKGFKKITIIEQENNLGLSTSIIKGVTSIVNKYGKIIVLEDDLIVGPYFLDFMNRSLAQYEHNDRVASIHGYIYPVTTQVPEVFFLKGADCWGWATWKRAWDIFEPDGLKLIARLKKMNLQNEFDFDGTYSYYQMLLDQSNGLNQSWAVRWYASAFLKDMLTLYPGRSQVQNIGLDNSGTHCSATEIYNTVITTKRVDNIYAEIKVNKDAREAFKLFFKNLQTSTSNITLMQKFKNLLRPAYKLIKNI